MKFTDIQFGVSILFFIGGEFHIADVHIRIGVNLKVVFRQHLFVCAVCFGTDILRGVEAFRSSQRHL